MQFEPAAVPNAIFLTFFFEDVLFGRPDQLNVLCSFELWSTVQAASGPPLMPAAVPNAAQNSDVENIKCKTWNYDEDNNVLIIHFKYFLFSHNVV